MIQQYRKKPVVIEAAQWDGTAEGATPIIDWILSGEHTARFHEAPGRGDDGSDLASIAINTLEGTMHATPGDYVIRGVQGEFYPCKPAIFEATYDAAQEPAESAEAAQHRLDTLTWIPSIRHDGY